MLAWLVTAALAEEPVLPSSTSAPTAKPPKEWSFAGLPIANYSSDTGFGYGAFASLVHNAPAGSDDPYKARIAAQLFFTTSQYQDHNVKLDFPSVGGSKYRWDLLVGYERWKQAPWYGVGNTAPRLHTTPPPEGTSEADIAAYWVPQDLSETEQKQYHQYDVSWARMLTNLRRNVSGPYDVFGSVLVRAATVDTYSASLLEAQEPAGSNGGVYSRLSVGAMYDTRDQEPSPTKGTWSEASIRGSMLGTDPGTVGLNLTDRRWVSLVKNERMVLANRFLLDLRRGTDPLFADALLGGSQFVEVAGSNNLRGLGNSRYRGDIVFLWTPELRIKYVAAGPLDIFGVPFLDVGRMFLWGDNKAIADGDAIVDNDLSHMHITGGLGHRFQLGNSMLVRLDVGVGSEEYGTIAAPQDIRKEFTWSLYLVFDHPF